ncbi:MAG TPA: 4Fe-4S dicluster domain-containing protein [Candidatus Paceibacterota bacterium]|nr:4Fe-4S dicluster domain-containing protein [Verrucomicrobiota bacterium]HRY48661.1 4Fe-4S dicluster domain-containing protein [Candidatus Paceibacterota bacterium]HSA01889.1 4Fe-4S dicluster domain-containing protein [Candidatus Paceibacterota bacterium]
MSLVDQVKEAGVVGAGGGGFPAHVKLAAKAEIVIANGAECEPLLHKDAVIMEHQADLVVDGMRRIMETVGAPAGVVGIKAKKHEAIQAIDKACRGTSIRVQLLGDYYPAGDEYDLVYTVTGRLIPPQGIPLQVGAVVHNVESLANIARAASGIPVTHKTLTVAGAVHRPTTLTTPIGTSFREAIQAAGGLTTHEPVIFVGGLMMGQVTQDLDQPITKTTTGIVILPLEHPLCQRRLHPASHQARIGKSACDQCRFCTEFCPRYLLGYSVEPHQVMRSLAFTATGADYFNQLAVLCCSCGLCTLYACPEKLYPKEACDAAKAALRARNIKWNGPTEIKPHGLRDGRRVPIKLLTQRLAVQEYDQPDHLQTTPLEPRRLSLPWKQGAGTPNQPRVRAGDSVKAGQPLGAIPDKSLGAIIHSPMNAKVITLTPDQIVLERL